MSALRYRRTVAIMFGFIMAVLTVVGWWLAAWDRLRAAPFRNYSRTRM